jgi:hypothetical protein
MTAPRRDISLAYWWPDELDLVSLAAQLRRADDRDEAERRFVGLHLLKLARNHLVLGPPRLAAV